MLRNLTNATKTQMSQSIALIGIRRTTDKTIEDANPRQLMPSEGAVLRDVARQRSRVVNFDGCRQECDRPTESNRDFEQMLSKWLYKCVGVAGVEQVGRSGLKRAGRKVPRLSAGPN